jgi:hypothetical protein
MLNPRPLHAPELTASGRNVDWTHSIWSTDTRNRARPFGLQAQWPLTKLGRTRAQPRDRFQEFRSQPM